MSKEQKFPLYDTLSELVNKDEKLDLNENYSRIINLTDEQQEIIAALIYHHNLMSEKTISKSKKQQIPYFGKTISDNKTGIIFTINLLPETLQKIIACYINTI